MTELFPNFSSCRINRRSQPCTSCCTSCCSSGQWWEALPLLVSAFPFISVQLWEWQLEELAMYFLLHSEAANLRHLPEALWFIFWCLRNSPDKMGQARHRAGASALETAC